MLLWITDLHIDRIYVEKDKDIARKIGEKLAKENPDANGLIISGDTSSGNYIERQLKELAEAFNKPIYFVLGNHDVWGCSFKQIDEKISNLNKINNIVWLQHSPVSLMGFDIVGVGGWYDAYHGNTNSNIKLNDWYHVTDLMIGVSYRDLLIELIRKEAGRHADILRRQLKETTKNTIIIVTHVPPYKESTWFKGEMSDYDTWLPWMSSASTGVEIDRYADNNPDKKIIVLAGHSHHPGIYKRKNITVYTGKSYYFYDDEDEVSFTEDLAGIVYEDKIIAYDHLVRKVEHEI